MNNISIIVAIAENNAIGINNQLLTYLPDDLKMFKRLTTGHIVIMGKKTFKSLPNGPLPNRTNVIISDNIKDYFEGCITVYSIQEAIDFCKGNDAFIIGGGMIYRQFLPLSNRLYLTIMHKQFEGDTFFPEIDYDEWKELSKEYHPKDEKHKIDFTWLVLERKSG
jgi:dihydrofolate reductase